MADIIDVLAEYSYAGIFLLLVALNAAPLLMPPTWMVLASFHAADSTLDVLVLSAVGGHRGHPGAVYTAPVQRGVPAVCRGQAARGAGP